MVRDATWWHRLYWKWRLSPFSRTYYAIKTFLHLQWHARKTALLLDDCMRAMGQMNHTSSYKTTCKKCGEKLSIESPDKGCMLMRTEVRSHLVHTGYWFTLPNGWKWRKD